MEKKQQLIKQLANINEAIDRLTEEAKRIKNELGDLLGPTTQEIGGTKISITYPRRADKKALAAEFPETEYPHYYTHDISASLVKKDIGENAYEKYTTISTTPVVKLS